MNSYTIKIADYELKLRCDLTPEALDELVKKVDGYITGLCARSNNISKTEAAILCALEYCSACDEIEQNKDRDSGERDQLVEENKKAAATIARLEARLEAQKEKYEAAAAAQKSRADLAAQTQKEKFEGRIENMKEKYETRIAQLKAKIDELRSGTAQQISMDIAGGEDEEGAHITPAETAPVAAETAPAVTEVAEVTEAEVSAANAARAVSEGKPTEAASEPAEKTPAAEEPSDKAKKSKSKVGSMFELLTFGDV